MPSPRQLTQRPSPAPSQTGHRQARSTSGSRNGDHFSTLSPAGKDRLRSWQIFHQIQAGVRSNHCLVLPAVHGGRVAPAPPQDLQQGGHHLCRRHTSLGPCPRMPCSPRQTSAAYHRARRRVGGPLAKSTAYHPQVLMHQVRGGHACMQSETWTERT